MIYGLQFYDGFNMKNLGYYSTLDLAEIAQEDWLRENWLYDSSRYDDDFEFVHINEIHLDEPPIKIQP